jgi:hypothetical protein
MRCSGKPILADGNERNEENEGSERSAGFTQVMKERLRCPSRGEWHGEWHSSGRGSDTSQATSMPVHIVRRQHYSIRRLHHPASSHSKYFSEMDNES